MTLRSDSLRILIVADDPLVRAGLAMMLNEQETIEVAGQIGSGEETTADVALYRPEVIIWDLGWDPAIGSSASRNEISRDDGDSVFDQLADLREAGWPIVALLPDDTLVLQVWTAGVRTILARQVETESLLTALFATAQNLTILDPVFSEVLVSEQSPLVPELIEALTPRESEVLQLLAEGLTNKAIAHRLEVSDHTIKFHVTAIMTKLGAQSRTEAVVQATRLGLILL